MAALSTYLHSLCYTVQLPVYKNRLAIFWSVFQPRHLMVVALFIVLGACSGVLLAEMRGYHGLWTTCNNQQRCLNEQMLFCFCHGVYVGLHFGLGYFVKKEHFLVFPSLQQRKLFRIRGHLRSHLWEGFVWTLKGLRLYYVSYYLLAFLLKKPLQSVLHLQPSDSSRIDSMIGLLDARLFIHCLVAGTILHSTWTFGLRLFRVFQTEAIKFHVVPVFSQEASQQLTRAICAKKTPLLMHLGYLDLYQLAFHSASRRRQVFSLNQSSQPATWNEISGECIALINSVTTRLGGQIQSQKTPAGLLSPADIPTSGPTTKDWPELPSVTSTGFTRRIVQSEKAKLWSYPPTQGVEGIGANLKPQPPATDSIQAATKKLTNTVKNLPKSFATALKRKPFITYFITDFPEAATQEQFADCKLQVWAVMSISELAAVSYQEDTYGVVQRSLPAIFTALISLSQAIDKHVKNPLSTSKSTRNVRVAIESNGKYAVKSAVQTALHRLSTTFSKERRTFLLTEEQHQYLDNF